MVLTDYLSRQVSEIESRLETHSATLRVLHFHWDEPVDGHFPSTKDYVLDFCPDRRAPRARGCFTDWWAPHYYERMGKVYLVPAGQTLRAQSEGGNQKAIMCWLNADAVHAVADEELQWTDTQLKACLNLTSPKIAMLLQRLADEARHPGFASDLLAEHMAAELAIELLRHLRGLDTTPIEGGLSERRLKAIDDRLETTVTPPQLGELAELCGISVRQLTRGYRRSRGSSIWKDLTERRVNLAKQLLNGGAPIKAIAFDLGFASPAAFAHAFKNHVGIAPKQYRDASKSS